MISCKDNPLPTKIELVYSFLWNEFRGRAVEFTEFTATFKRRMAQSLAMFLNGGVGGKPILLLREYEDKYFAFVQMDAMETDDGTSIPSRWMICPTRTVEGMPHGGLVRLSPDQQSVLAKQLPEHDQPWKLFDVDFQRIANEFKIDRFSVMATAMAVMGYERRPRPNYPTVSELPEQSGREFVGICSDGLIKYVRVIGDEVLPNVNLQVDGVGDSLEGCFVFGRFHGEDGVARIESDPDRELVLEWSDFVEAETFPNFWEWLANEKCRNIGLWPCCKTTTPTVAIFYRGAIYRGFEFDFADGRLKPGRIKRSEQTYESVEQLMAKHNGIEISFGADENRFIKLIENVTEVILNKDKKEKNNMKYKYDFFDRLIDLLSLGTKNVYIDNYQDAFKRLGDSLGVLIKRGLQEDSVVTSADVNELMVDLCTSWEEGWKPIDNGDYSKAAVFQEEKDHSLIEKKVKAGSALSANIPAVFLLRCDDFKVRFGESERDVYLRVKLDKYPKSGKNAYGKYSFKIDPSQLIFSDSMGNSLSGVYDIPLFIPDRDKMWHKAMALAGDWIDEKQFNAGIVQAWWNCANKKADRIVLNSGALVGDDAKHEARPIEIHLTLDESAEDRDSYSYEVMLGESEHDVYSTDFPDIEIGEEVEWDGEDYKPNLQDTDKYTVKYNPVGPWSDAGIYSVTVKLKTKKHFWADGFLGEERTMQCEILKATNDLNGEPRIDPSWDENGVWNGKVSGCSSLYGEVEITYDEGQKEMPASIGKHVAHLHVDGTKNYGGIDHDLEFEITVKPTVENCDEKTFLERFIKYATDICGFNYDVRDLIRFHTSVKCGLLTLIGGEPGCGKSSLVKLYARALAASSWPRESNGVDDDGTFLRVDVNPAWAEPGDLIGFVMPSHEGNEHVFLPANNGLFKFLKKADDNFPKQDAHKMYVVSFEEMNLARVELYFAEFMQLMSEDGKRQLSDEYKLDEKDRPVSVNENVRFAGTYNEDWTVQRFSSRFLDRCNVIMLSAPSDEKIFDVDIGTCKDWPDKNKSLAISVEAFSEWMQCNDILKDEADYANKVFSDLQTQLGSEVFKVLHLMPSLRVRGEILKYMHLRPSLYWDETNKKLIRFNDQGAAFKKSLDEAFAQRILSKCEPSHGLADAYSALLKALKSSFDDKDGKSISCLRVSELMALSTDMAKWSTSFSI